MSPHLPATQRRESNWFQRLGNLVPSDFPSDAIWKGFTNVIISRDVLAGLLEILFTHRTFTMGAAGSPAALLRRELALTTTTRRVPGTGGPVSWTCTIASGASYTVFLYLSAFSSCFKMPFLVPLACDTPRTVCMNFSKSHLFFFQ